MDIIREPSDGQARMRLQGDCNIYSAAELKTALLESLRTEPALELDLAAVTELDSAGIQVLMAAKQFARAGGGALHLLNHSAPVLELIEIYDLAVWLGDPLIVSAAPAAAA